MAFDEKSLEKIGLTEAESVVYMSLLKFGLSTVKEISTRCRYQRSNLYDILEQLQAKGLVSSHIENNTKYYASIDPESLVSYLKEKEDYLNSILGQLHELQKTALIDTTVEVYKGENGMKSLFRDILKVGKTLYGINVCGQLREHNSQEFVEFFVREMKRKKMKYYPIYTSRDFDPPYCTEIRYLSEEHRTPVVTFIYGDNVCINIWEPTLIAIIIRSADVAKTYKKHFDMIWALAKK